MLQHFELNSPRRSAANKLYLNKWHPVFHWHALSPALPWFTDTSTQIMFHSSNVQHAKLVLVERRLWNRENHWGSVVYRHRDRELLMPATGVARLYTSIQLLVFTTELYYECLQFQDVRDWTRAKFHWRSVRLSSFSCQSLVTDFSRFCLTLKIWRPYPKDHVVK